MIQFNIGIFNPRNQQIYIDQLKVLLQSIWDVYQESVKVAVYFTQVDENDINEIERKYPHIILKETSIKFQYKKNNIPLAAQKCNIWYSLMLDCNTKHQVFLDADMLLLKRIDHFFNNDFDIGFTYKTEEAENLKKPLNTAIILLNNNKKAKKFMKYWNKKINIYLDSKNPYGKGWGAADQQVLGEFLGGRKFTNYRGIITKKGIKFKGFPCKVLNNLLHPNPDDKE